MFNVHVHVSDEMVYLKIKVIYSVTGYFIVIEDPRLRIRLKICVSGCRLSSNGS